MYDFKVPDRKKIRLIVNSDAKNEADDQYTIAHALLTPKFIVKGLIGAHFGPKRSKTSMEDSCRECEKVLQIMGMEDSVKVFRGAKAAVISETDYEFSEGAKLIVDEALSDDELPLFVIFIGPITDLACAYLHEPKIAGRLTAIWIGGNKYPNGGSEFNLSNDIKAANIIFNSNIDLWQIPASAFSTLLVSLAELQTRVAPHGKIGEYLFKQLVEFNETFYEEAYPNWPLGESWCLCDSATIGVMLDPQSHSYTIRKAPFINDDMTYTHRDDGRDIRVYDTVNARFILEDMYAKLELFAKLNK